MGFKICYALGMKYFGRFMQDFYFCAPLKELISHSYLLALLAPPGTGSPLTPSPPPAVTPRRQAASTVRGSVAALSLTKTCLGKL